MASVKVDKAALAKTLEGDGPVTALKALGEQVAAEVRRIAPHHTGYYIKSIRVGEPVKGHDGLVVPVESTDSFAHLVEFGSVNNEPYAPLRRAVRNLGLKVVEVPKP